MLLMLSITIRAAPQSRADHPAGFKNVDEIRVTSNGGASVRRRCGRKVLTTGLHRSDDHDLSGLAASAGALIQVCRWHEQRFSVLNAATSTTITPTVDTPARPSQ
jgi:hypothetical protein